ALYLVLRSFTHHVHATPHDLSWLGLVNITDHANVGWGPLLLVIYVASQTLSTLLMSTTMDKTQRAVMLAMPLVFVFVVVNFPVGLVLYWLTTNLWTVGQGIVTRRLVPRGPVAPPKKTSRTPPREGEGGPPREGDGGGDGARKVPERPKPSPTAAQPPRRV